MNISQFFSDLINKIPLSIRAKIALPYVALATLLAFGAALIVTQIVFDTIEERFTNQLVEAGKLASERMVAEENHLLTAMRQLAFSEGIPTAIQESNESKLRDLAFGTTVNNQLEAVEFIDLSGNLILSMYHKKGGLIEEYDFLTGDQSPLIDHDFVNKVVTKTTDGLGDKYSDLVETQKGLYFLVAGPVIDSQNKLIGVVVVGTSLDTLARQLREETLAQITFYDPQGNVLSSTFSTPSPLTPEFTKSLFEQQDTISFERETTRSVEQSYLGYRELLGVWEGRGDVDLGVLGVSLGESFIISTTTTTRFQIIVLGATTLLLVLFFGISVSLLLTKPIMALVNAAKKVASGDYRVKVEPTSRDEIALLSRTFNEMIESINDSRLMILNSYDNTLEGWSNALELRDHETSGHSQRVTNLMKSMMDALGIDGETRVNYQRGVLLHDIGKMGIPDSILNKPGPLDVKERQIMQQHPIYAIEMLKNIEFLKPSLSIPYSHHERWDGTGYPLGLKGEEIPLEARIFAIVDVWDAITSDRPYRNSMSKEEAIQTIRNGNGTQFDPKLVDVFLKIVDHK
ncbi:MAG: HD domain-containing phosphohydrolase [Anaerolineaceae bacterium]